MIEVKVPEIDRSLEQEDYFWGLVDYSYHRPKDRPWEYINHIHFHLYDIHHDWLSEHNIEYRIMKNDTWYIIFEKKSEAALFKLTWC